MDKIKNTPEIRFKDFNEEWKSISLSSSADFLKGKGYKKDDLTSSGQEIILYGRMYTNYKTAYKDIDSYVKQVPGSVLSKAGDVIVPGSGETAQDISIASAVLKDDIILGGDLNVIRPKNELDAVFLALSLSSGTVKEELTKMAEGATIAHLRNKNLQKISIISPSKEEQEQIGKLALDLDEKLEIEKAKHQKLLNFKKAMLEDMFPKEGESKPKIRFDGFDDEWRYTTLNNILSSEKKGKAQLSLLKPGENLYLDADALNGNSEFFCDAVPDVAKTDVLILWDGSKAGRVYSNVEGVLGSTLKSLTFNDPINSYYVYSFLDSKKDTIFNYYRTPNIPHVVRNFTSSFEIPIPSPEEQALIGNFFKILDEKIELSERKISKIENFKKSLLDKMFV